MKIESYVKFAKKNGLFSVRTNDPAEVPTLKRFSKNYVYADRNGEIVCTMTPAEFESYKSHARFEQEAA